MICINKNLEEYQTQLSRSGISDSEYESYAAYYLENYGRYPHLDEIPNANSEKYLKDNLKVYGETTNFVKLKDVQSFILESTPQRIQQKLNSIFRDKEIELIQFDDNTSIIKINNRPSKYKKVEDLNFDINNPNSFTFFVDGLYKMADLYGINFKMITDEQLKLDPYKKLHATDAKAFVYNGDIYINVDQASVDSPIHEMLHLLVGSMRFTNSESYSKLLETVQKLPEFNFLLKQFPNRTINDVSEEILVDQVSKLLTSKESILKDESLYDIFYEIRRNLDTLLMGNKSVANVDVNDVIKSSILELGKLVQSKRLLNNYSSHLDDAQVHRLTNNIKSDLMSKNELEQVCV